MKKINTDVAYDHIRKRIVSGEYRPGQALVTEMLSAETGVSRTPVRDALRKLEADGLVIIQPRLGASVKKMDVKEFREMCDLRLALESHAAGLAATNRTEAELREIKFALEAMRQLTERIKQGPLEQTDLNDLKREDVRFHIAIMSAAKNDLMKKEILRLHLINRLVSGPAGVDEKPDEKVAWDARRKVVLASHEEIYSAIAAGNAIASKQAMDHHIQDLIDTNLRRIEQSERGSVVRELTAEELAYGS